jgi:hypothetical protein
VIAAAKLGAHVGTLPPNVLQAALQAHADGQGSQGQFLDGLEAKTGQSIL